MEVSLNNIYSASTYITSTLFKVINILILWFQLLIIMG